MDPIVPLPNGELVEKPLEGEIDTPFSSVNGTTKRSKQPISPRCEKGNLLPATSERNYQRNPHPF